MSTITLADILALLERALTNPENPALIRLAEDQRTVAGLARAYLPREVFAFIDDEAAPHHPPGVAYSTPRALRRPLDLTDPGTAHALIPLLALAHGRDPGPGGRGVRWTGLRDADGQRYGWWLSGDPIVPITEPYYIAYVPEPGGDDLEIVASNIANEPDDLAALVMAVRHVLGQP